MMLRRSFVRQVFAALACGVGVACPAIALSQCNGATTGAQATEKPDGASGTADAGKVPFTDPFMGATGCDGGLDAGDNTCELMMPVDGGITGTLSVSLGPAAVCVVDSNGGIGTVAMLDGNSIDVLVEPANPIQPGQLATGLAAQVILVENDVAKWATPPTECQITLTSNACAPISFAPGRYLVSGTGSCSGPARLTRGDAGATVTIGDFYFSGELQFDD